MMHIDEGRLQAWVDQELQLDERRKVDRHLASCEACRSELGALQSLSAHFAGAVEQLDEAPRRPQRATGLPRRTGSELFRRILPRAAVLLLFAGAAASATIPGMPVRDWLDAARERTPPAQLATPEAVEPTPVAADAPIEAGVSVEAAEGAVDIVIREASRDLRIRAKFVEGTRAGVYASGDASSGRFQTGVGRIEVSNARSGELRIELPLGAAMATVIVNGREVLRQQNGRIGLPLATADGGSREIDFSVEP
jgi:hypothetical protein